MQARRYVENAVTSDVEIMLNVRLYLHAYK